MFSLFMDETMAYSCAIFEVVLVISTLLYNMILICQSYFILSLKHRGEELKNAQLRKVHTLIDKVIFPQFFKKSNSGT